MRLNEARSRRDRFITVAGIRTRFVEEGCDRPGTPLVVLHGYNGSCDYFYPYCLPGLGEERRVVAPDLPGNGLSARMRRYSLSAFVDFIVSFLDALGLDQVDLMGHSMGGQLAIATAATAPERVRKLILADSAGLPGLAARVWFAPLSMLTDASLRQVAMYPTFIKIGLRARAPRESLAIALLETVESQLERIQVPSLVVWGAKDRIVPLRHGKAMARGIPGARLVVINGTGHTPFYEKPAAFNSAVLGFLNE